MERSGFHDQKNPAILAQGKLTHCGGGEPDVKLLSSKYREHGLAFEQVDGPNRPWHDIAGGNALGVLGCDDNVVGTDTNLEWTIRRLLEVGNEKFFAV